MRHRQRCGSYVFEALNVPWQKKNEIMWEAFEVMKGVWSNPIFDYDGQYFKCKRVQLSIPLVQKPFPPFWLPTRSRESIELAVKHGMSTAQWCPPKPKLVREFYSTTIDRYIGKPNPSVPSLTWASNDKSMWLRAIKRQFRRQRIIGSTSGTASEADERMGLMFQTWKAC